MTHRINYDEKELMRMLGEDLVRLQNAGPIELEIGAVELFIIVQQVQLALKLPQNQGRFKISAEVFCREVQQKTFKNHPAIYKVIELGFQHNENH